ncbi:MAG TPA: hypothetical protein DDW52_08270, partial [Planctomycetaceae bacterium]|nr:hypothetical protein [Planctomycetaceae bacterium]
EQAGFHLPPGFSIDLFASEPMIAKPLNMAWDKKGRLWVTSTTEYPYPAKDGNGKDQVLVLEDTDGDGSADKRTVFADGLNIPMGLLPLQDGAIVFSIPNLVRYYDDDGDLRADRQEVLLGPFDTSRDTHGMVNALRRGDDGWVYACHGFNNRSTITDKSGDSIYLESGNVFRFTPDGQHVELYTRGQVNPFGMTRDAWGRWYTADCHSKPLTALLAGGCYQSFSRPHDGLGFAPEMMQHLHGSTAISGVHLYDQSQFPAAYRNRFYSGNVMTSRINCNRLLRSGATVTAAEAADFLTSDDPWFRPVDIQVGPDESLYVADFYNKIIGHYEVPLDHPGRDRTSGRIWRISYAENTTRQSPSLQHDTDDLSTVEDLVDAAQNGSPLVSARAYRLAAHAPRFRFGEHDWAVLLRLATEQLATSIESPSAKSLLLVEFLGTHGEAETAIDLLESVSKCEDRTLRQALRIAARDLLQNDEILAETHSNLFVSGRSVSGRSLEDVRSAYLAILPAIGSGKATAQYVSTINARSDASPAAQEQAIELALNWLSNRRDPGSGDNDSILRDCLSLIAVRYSDSIVDEADAIVKLLRSIHPAHVQGDKVRAAHAKIAKQVNGKLANQLKESPATVYWNGDWPQGKRRNASGIEQFYQSSFPLGEKFVGKATSQAFAVPKELSFELVGHNGPPSEPDQQLNFVRLVDSNGSELIRAYPPRSDIAKRVVWDLSSIDEKMVHFEAIDGDSAGAYAWIAFGSFSLAELNRNASLRLVKLLQALANSNVDYSKTLDRISSRSLYAAAVQLPREPQLAILAGALKQDGQIVSAELVRFALAEKVDVDFARYWNSESETVAMLIPAAKGVLRSVETTRHPKLSRLLLATSRGCELLAQLVADGVIGPLSLGERPELIAPVSGTTKEVLSAAFAEQQSVSASSGSIEARVANLDWESAQNTVGESVFKQKCAVCHQLGGEGALIGPQLDGAIKRSRGRLAEDIMLPNLNVDRAFRTTLLLLDDGSVVSGMLVGEDERALSIVKADGKRVEIAAERVDERRESKSSLMPTGLADDLTDQQLASLLTYLTWLGRQGDKK